jgi:L-threonine-O-3-phosphate decarboxylase/precorrin-6x reductase
MGNTANIQKGNVLLLCGTQETNTFIEMIRNSGFNSIVSTATDTFLSITTDSNTKRVIGRLDYKGFLDLIHENNICAIINACHPFASSLRFTVNEVARECAIPCFNYVRADSAVPLSDNRIFAESHDDAADIAFSFNKPVLLTTGSNNLVQYVTQARQQNIAIIARVLPKMESLTACYNAGLTDNEIIAARGPFTLSENIATLQRYNIGVIVTKNSGKESGFDEKLLAAEQCHCKTVIIKRPSLINCSEITNTISMLSHFLNKITMGKEQKSLPDVNVSNSSEHSDSFQSIGIDMHNAHGGNLKALSALSGVSENSIIDFSANINPLGPIPEFTQVVTDSSAVSMHYPDPDYTEFVSAISRFGKWKTSEITVGNGASELIYACTKLNKFKRALIPVPSYSDYAISATRAGLPVHYYFCKEENNFTIDTNDLSTHIRPADLIFIGRPNNPSGSIIAVETLLNLINRHPSSFFIIDESFIEFTEHASVATSLPENAIMIRSMTKFYAIPGLRLGYAISNGHLTQTMKSYLIPWGLNIIATSVGISSLNNLEYQQFSRLKNSELRDSFYKKLSLLNNIKVYPSACNFFLIKLMNNIKGSILFSILLKQNFAIRQCSNFTGLDDSYIRIAVRNDDENDRFTNALKATLHDNYHYT